MNRVDRLLALILYLQTRRVVTAEDMAQHFELSVRTIYRDLSALSEAGVPIMAEAGVGYSLMKGYLLPPVNFSKEEAIALVTGGMLVAQFADASLKIQMESALGKVRAVLPRGLQDQLARLERNMTATANAALPSQADLCLLQQALAAQRVLRFQYQGAGKREFTGRTVEPMGLIRYLDRWHLIAWCRERQDYRDFRADRMREVAMLNETFQPREPFSVNDYIRSMPQPTLHAQVRFDLSAADRAKREWWLGILEEQQTGDGVILTLATVTWEGLAAWLLSFGMAATVVAPDSLTELLIKTARNIADHHKKKSLLT